MVKQGRDPEPITIVLKTYRAIPALLGGDKGFFNYFFYVAQMLFAYKNMIKVKLYLVCCSKKLYVIKYLNFS